MPAYSVPYVHSGDPAYAPPLLRAPSPTSSIGTDYGPDEPHGAEHLMSDAEFARMCQDKLKLNNVRREEEFANFDPLLPKCKTEEEERILYMRVMHNLRHEIKRLQEDALFEQTVLRSSVLTEEQKPSSNDIDHILQSMMGTTISPSATPVPVPPTPLPATDDLLGGRPILDFPSPGAPGGFVFATPSAADSSTPVSKRRVTRNMGKSARR